MKINHNLIESASETLKVQALFRKYTEMSQLLLSAVEHISPPTFVFFSI